MLGLLSLVFLRLGKRFKRAAVFLLTVCRKSTLLNKMTNTASVAAAYEFTTLTAIPGVMEYEGAKIQLLDLPGIVEGASQGRGRGRQVVAGQSKKALPTIKSLLTICNSCQDSRPYLDHVRCNKVA